MNDVDEILDFDDNIDLSFSEDLQVADSNLLEDGLLDEMNFSTGVQQIEEEKSGTKEKEKEDTEITNNQLSENIESNNDSTLPQQKDQEEFKFSEVDDFDMDTDFLNDYDGNVDDVNIEDDEFWKELELDPPNEVAKEENDKSTKEEFPNNFDKDNTNINSIENTPKTLTDGIKVDNTRLDVSSHKSIKRTSKSPEKEDGEIPNTSVQSQKQKLSQPQQQGQTQRQAQTQRTQVQRQQQQNNHQQQNLQNYRGRGGRRNNDWRPINNNNSFLNSGMSSFRSGFGPGLDMAGMPMPLNNPPMLPNLPHGMIGPNIHVNPNFARLRPHTLPFGNPMSQYPMGSGGPLNMMPYQGQIEMHPYHPSITPMTSGRGNNNSYAGRGGGTGFNHSPISPRRPTNQQNNSQTQRPMQSSPKRKVPNDGFDQKEPDSKKISVTNGKSPVPDSKSAAASQKNVEKNSPPATKNCSSPPINKTSNSKQGTTTNVNKISSATAKNKIPPSNAFSSPSTKQASKPVQKLTNKNTTKNASVKASVASSPTSKSTSKTDGTASSGGNKLTIKNVVQNVTKRDIQDLANKVPIGFSSITFDRSAQTAEIVFETSDGAKMFRRMHNRSLLYGSNIVINFS